jgi:hypothetical protein
LRPWRGGGYGQGGQEESNNKESHQASTLSGLKAPARTGAGSMPMWSRSTPA